MPPRKIAIDHTIVEEINHGNVHVAKALNTLRSSGAEIWISHEIVKAHLNTEADRRLLMDLGIRDDYMYSISRRGSHTLKWGNTVDTLGIDFRNSPTANLAIEQKAELMTMNKGLAADWAKSGGVATKEISYLKPLRVRRLDYSRARNLLNLKPLTINAKGQVNPQPKKYLPAPGPAVLIKGSNGKSTGWGPKVSGYEKAYQGSPLKPPREVGPDPRGSAKAGGHMIALQGVNKILHSINDHIQGKRLDEKWKKLAPVVEEERSKDPALGVLILVYYSRGQGAADSSITPVNIFQDISVAYGYTYEDAIVRYGQTPRLAPAGAGDQISVEKQWIEPLAPFDASNLTIPYPMAGVAAFIPGKEKLVNVKWSGKFGFDERMKSVTTLKVDPGAIVSFFYLWPPETISYFNGKQFIVSIDRALAYPGEVVSEELTVATVPVVELDSSLNPFDASAAMIFPANNYTARLFKQAPPTRDNNAQLRGLSMEFIRWIRPENMRVIRHLASEFASPSAEEISVSVR